MLKFDTLVVLAYLNTSFFNSEISKEKDFYWYKPNFMFACLLYKF